MALEFNLQNNEYARITIDIVLGKYAINFVNYVLPSEAIHRRVLKP